MTRLSRLSTLLLCTLPFAAAAAPKAGQWEYVTEIKMPGMTMPQGMQMPKLPEGVQLPPGISMPKMSSDGMTQTVTFKQCITADNPVPVEKKEDQHCKITKMDRKGDSVDWAMECQTDHGPMTGEGHATYSATSMQGESHFNGTMDGRPVKMDHSMKGRYLGPCPD